MAIEEVKFIQSTPVHGVAAAPAELASLPVELVTSIFSMTDVYTVRNLAQTCTLFLSLADQDAVWRVFAKQFGLGDRLLFVEDTAFKSMVKRHYVVAFEEMKQKYPKNLFKFSHPELLFRLPSYSYREDENDGALMAKLALHSKYPVIRHSQGSDISIQHDRSRIIKCLHPREKPLFNPAQSSSSPDMEQELMEQELVDPADLFHVPEAWMFGFRNLSF